MSEEQPLELNPVLPEIAAAAAPPVKTHWPSIWQFGLGLVVVLSVLGTAFSLLLVGVIQLISGEVDVISTTAVFMTAFGTAAIGFLAIPSAYHGLMRVMNRPVHTPAWWDRLSRILRPHILIILFPLVVIVGHFTSEVGVLALITLPVLNILGAGLPVYWLLWVGRRGLPVESAQRIWGLFISGMIATPFIVLILEAISLVLVGALILIINEDLLFEINRLGTYWTMRGPNPDDIMPILSEYLLRPSVLGLGLIFIAVIVPLVEELFKPLGVWLLAGRNLSPAEGFTSGLICGAGYALAETLALVSSPVGWSGLITIRMATSLLHIFTTGLTGWALASAWQKKSYLQLGITYLAVVAVHGLWNATVVISAVVSFADELGSDILFPEYFETGGASLLLLLSAVIFIGLVFTNRRLRAAQVTSPLPVSEGSL